MCCNTINSPGGSPVQSHLIYNFIRQQAKKIKKVIVFAEDVAASGGYLIACAEMKYMQIQVQLLDQ